MPLARYAVYRGGPQIWVAPTADDSDGWLASMRHIAIESGAFVVSVPQFIPASAFPDDFPVPLPADKEVFGRGGAAVDRADVGRGDRRTALRRGGNARRRLRPAPRPARQALVRRGRPLQPRGRASHRRGVAAHRGAGAMTSPYHDGSRRLQDRFDTRRLADRLDEKFLCAPLIIDATTARSSSGWTCSSSRRPTRAARPQCSYKGGEPGFVRVLDEQHRRVPELRRQRDVPVDRQPAREPARRDAVHRLRLRAALAAATQRDREHRRARRADRRRIPEAQFVVRVRATQVFPNCPRYIHRMALVERSRFVPRADHETPVPDWKRTDWACDVLPADDPARGA